MSLWKTHQLSGKPCTSRPATLPCQPCVVQLGPVDVDTVVIDARRWCRSSVGSMSFIAS